MWPPTTLPLVLHIPHAGTAIPSAVLDQFLSVEQIHQTVLDLTDWYTNELFRVPGCLRVETPISRVVVDTERYIDDALEPAASFGQGVIYTHTHSHSHSHGHGHTTLPLRRRASRPLRRTISEEERTELLNQYYTPWHLKLGNDVEEQRNRFGYCVIIDCHSFPSIPLPTEVSSNNPRPDICIGTTATNTPSWLEDAVLKGFRKLGYRCESNAPFSGSMVPSKFEGDPRVVSVMIEINRDLYLEPEDTIHSYASNRRLTLGQRENSPNQSTLGGNAALTERFTTLQNQSRSESQELGTIHQPKKGERFELLRNQITTLLLAIAQEAECRLGQ
jgi:N-formylglutamate amidohydrolase